MRLEWERPGIVRLTARIEEIAALVAGGRLSAQALETEPGKQAGGLTRVLADFDRAARALQTRPGYAAEN
jgi:hypothetical protein